MPSTPFFKELGPLFFGRSSKRKLIEIQGIDRLEDLYEIFGECLPQKLLAPSEKGVGSRQRKLPLSVTFWAFLSQVLSPKSSCRDVVRRVSAWWRWEQSREQKSLTPSAYCQARLRLAPELLESILAHSAWHLERNVMGAERGLEGRTVKIIDGTGLSMPDTAENQAVWPQSTEQKQGCGFPLLKLVGVFSLGSGAVLDHVVGTYYDHEAKLASQLYAKLRKGDVVLMDRAYSSYGTLCQLSVRGIDVLTRVHQARKVDLRRGKRLGTGDRLMEWIKPAQCPPGLEPELYQELPNSCMVRIIEVRLTQPGFRTQHALLVTTMIDAQKYPADVLRQLYAERWTVELHYGQLKTLLGMDVLSGKSPEVIERELLVHLIAYNLVRAVLQRAAHVHRQPLERLSFKGALDTIRHYSAVIRASMHSPRKQSQLAAEMLRIIAHDHVPDRPGRTEPRAKKRRQKNYHLLTKPRDQMVVPAHRNRPKSNPPKQGLS